MSPNEEAAAPQKPPTNACELVAQIGCNPHEGVVVALLTESIERVTSREISVRDKKNRPMFLIEADIFAWGTRVLDLVGESNEKVKWWRVKEAASVGGGQIISVRWEGPISEIPERYFEPGNVLMVRFYDHGPVFFPLEKPVVREEAEEARLMEEAIGE